MKHPERMTVQQCEIERHGCDAPAMGALLIVALVIMAVAR